MTGWAFVIVVLGKQPLYDLSEVYETRAQCEQHAQVNYHYDMGRLTTEGARFKIKNKQYCFYVGR